MQSTQSSSKAAACLFVLSLFVPTPSGTARAAESVPLVVCPPEVSDSDCDYRSLAEAVARAANGSTLLLLAGTYREAAVVRAHGLKLIALPGARMTGVAVQGKAALVVKGSDVTIEGLECSGISVADGNGACVRAEGRNLTLRRVNFHDSQVGVFGGRGRLVIEDSLFARLGGEDGARPGRAHGLQIGRKVDELILLRSRVLSSGNEGHEIRSRARRIVIEDSVIASLDGNDSRAIDLPNGGDVVIRRNLLQKGPNSSNPDIIAIGLEGEPGGGSSANSIVIEDNTIIVDRDGQTRLLHVKNAPALSMSGNTVVGGSPYREAGNQWVPDRDEAGLPPYPDLPPWPPR